MKKQEYIKPTIEIVEINGESIMLDASLPMNNEKTLTDDNGVAAKGNSFLDFDVWGEDEAE